MQIVDLDWKRLFWTLARKVSVARTQLDLEAVAAAKGTLEDIDSMIDRIATTPMLVTDEKEEES